MRPTAWFRAAIITVAGIRVRPPSAFIQLRVDW